MSSSLILTNALFCTFALLLLFPLLRVPNILTYKKGIPIFVTVTLVIGKMIIPYEFSFTNTIASKNILPIIKTVEDFQLLKNIRGIDVLLYIWFFTSILILVSMIFKHWRLKQIISLVPEIKNDDIIQIIAKLSKDKQIRNRPKIIQLDISTGPFIVDWRNPVIVLPLQLSENEVRFIFLHELEHIKHHHILIKVCIEIVTAIYWWNPIVWLLRREVIRAMEIQADTNIMRTLPKKAGFSYLETLIKISKRVKQNQNSNLSISFTLKNSMIEYRMRTALKYGCFKKHKKTPSFFVIPLVLSIALFVISFVYTFEPYYISSEKIENSFSVSSKTDHFILREDGLYDLYVNGECVVTISSIPKDLQHIPVYKYGQDI